MNFKLFRQFLPRRSNWSHGLPCIWLCLLSTCGCLMAQKEWSMEQVIQTALMQNPDLIAARYAIAEAYGRLAQAGLLPNPNLELSGMSDVLFSTEKEGAFSIGLSQQFPVTSRLSISRQIKRVEVAQSLREIREAERLLIARVASLYVRSVVAKLKVDATKVIEQSAKKSLALAKDQFSQGQGSLADVGLAQVEERRWYSSTLAAHTVAEITLLELKTELGMHADQPLALKDSLEQIIARFPKSFASKVVRPDADLLLLEMEGAGLEVRLSKAEVWEGFQIGLEYSNEQAVDEPEGLGTSQFLGIKVSIPLPVWDQNKGTIQEKVARQQKMQAKVKAVELEVQNSVLIAARKVALLQGQWKVFHGEVKSVLSETEQQLSDGFQQGRVDMGDLLQVRMRTADLYLESISLQEELALALIELQKVGGYHSEISKPYLEPLSSRTKPESSKRP